MKIVYVICNEVFEDRIMGILARSGIDYYTCWEHVKGKGHETEPHLGTRSFPGMNAVLMIALPDESPLNNLIKEIEEANKGIVKPDDRIRLFQVPLERIV
jgi:nitrogen regulatory protein PII